MTQSKQGLKRPVSEEEIFNLAFTDHLGGSVYLPKLYTNFSMNVNMCICLRIRCITFSDPQRGSQLMKAKPHPLLLGIPACGSNWILCY